MKRLTTLLKPIERTEKEMRKVKNTWAGSVNYLLDLKTKKQQLLQNLQNEIKALQREIGSSIDEDLN